MGRIFPVKNILRKKENNEKRTIKGIKPLFLHKVIKEVFIMVESMEKIVSLCKSRGYVYPGSEIYGGLANTWDYGPLGVELKNNVKKAWMKKFVQESKYNVGLDAAILMNL